jgi:TPR repeat protein
LIGNPLFGETFLQKECLNELPAGIAREKHTAAARAGNVQSMFCVGAIHLYVGREVDKAIPWLEQAANAGHLRAPLVLGILYEKGTGVPEDPAKAAKWYQKGVENGNVAAMRRLAEMYRLGLGVPRDEKKANELLDRAAQLGDKHAAFLQDKREHERVHPKPGDDIRAEAYRLYKLKKFAEAAKLYEKCAKMGNDICQMSLGVHYEEGLGVSQNYSQAVLWYRKSADQGYSIAQKTLGLMYELGRGVPENWREAARLYALSADKYHDGAYNLARMYQFGMGVPQDRGAAIAWFKIAATLGHAQGNYWARWLNNYSNCIGFRNEQEQRTLGYLRCPADPVGVTFRNSNERYAYLRQKGKEFSAAEASASSWDSSQDKIIRTGIAVDPAMAAGTVVLCPVSDSSGHISKSIDLRYDFSGPMIPRATASRSLVIPAVAWRLSPGGYDLFVVTGHEVPLRTWKGWRPGGRFMLVCIDGVVKNMYDVLGAPNNFQ